MTEKDVQRISKQYNVSIETTQKAIDNIRTGKSQFIAISGKIGAGKDTIAPLLLAFHNKTEDIENLSHESFAYTLKNEVQQVIEKTREENEKHQQLFAISELISQQQGIPLEQASNVVEFIFEEVTNNRSLTSYSRTPGIRKALQYWGTEVRRAQDPNYWVKKTIQKSYTNIAEGKSIYITDVRFPNEADSVLDTFGTVIRLNISPEIQEQRIMKRDGLKVSEDARSHPSETSLDSYSKFNATVNVDYLTPEEVVEKIKNQLA